MQPLFLVLNFHTESVGATKIKFFQTRTGILVPDLHQNLNKKQKTKCTPWSCRYSRAGLKT